MTFVASNFEQPDLRYLGEPAAFAELVIAGLLAPLPAAPDRRKSNVREYLYLAGSSMADTKQYLHGL